MKRHLTTFFIVLSVLVVIISFQFNVRWNGIVGWSTAIICLLFAAYFTKYIPEHEQSDRANEKLKKLERYE